MITRKTQKHSIRLSDHFTYKKLIRFTIPSIATMIFTSIYGVVDGFFVSNYVGGTPFAALNLIYPFIMILSAVGFMFGTGGSALVAVTLGMGKKNHAGELFSLFIYLVAGIGAVLSVLGIVFAEPVSRILGATGDMVYYCVLYARISFIGLVPFMLQNSFQSFLVTAERPRLGFYITIAAGFTNMLLDWLFMGVFKMGLGSAAAATVIGQAVGGFIPLMYFILPNSSLLRIGRTKMYMGSIFKTAANGSSEFMSNISMSVVSMLYNLQLMRFAGERGVSAYGIIIYATFVFFGVFFGYSFGVSPIIGYAYGAENTEELRNVYKKSLKLISFAAIFITLSAELMARPLSYIFASHDDVLLDMTEMAIRIYAISFLMLGFNIFGSSFFTALNNGLISAVLSFLRVFLFQVVAVLILPVIFGLYGIWFSVVAAEAMALAVTIIFLSIGYNNLNRNKYPTTPPIHEEQL